MFRFASKRLKSTLLALSVIITVLAVGTGIYLSSRETITVNATVSGSAQMRTVHGDYCVEGSVSGFSIDGKPSKTLARVTNCSDKPAHLVIVRLGYFPGGNSYENTLKEGVVEPGKSFEVTLNEAHAQFNYEVRVGDWYVHVPLDLWV